MRWLDHVIAAAPNFFASAQIFSNFCTSLATRLHFPRDGHVLRVGEPSRLNSVRNPKSEIKIAMSRQSDSNRRPADYKLFGCGVLNFLQML